MSCQTRVKIYGKVLLETILSIVSFITSTCWLFFSPPKPSYSATKTAVWLTPIVSSSIFSVVYLITHVCVVHVSDRRFTIFKWEDKERWSILLTRSTTSASSLTILVLCIYFWLARAALGEFEPWITEDDQWDSDAVALSITFSFFGLVFLGIVGGFIWLVWQVPSQDFVIPVWRETYDITAWSNESNASVSTLDEEDICLENFGAKGEENVEIDDISEDESDRGRRPTGDFE